MSGAEPQLQERVARVTIPPIPVAERRRRAEGAFDRAVASVVSSRVESIEREVRDFQTMLEQARASMTVEINEETLPYPLDTRAPGEREQQTRMQYPGLKKSR